MPSPQTIIARNRRLAERRKVRYERRLWRLLFRLFCTRRAA